MRCAHIPLYIIQLDPEYILVAEISYLYHSYSSYSLLGRAVSQPFLGKKWYFRTQWSENSTFGPETAEETARPNKLYELYEC